MILKSRREGALNFLEIDDVPLEDEGELIDLDSTIKLKFKDNIPVFPEINFIPQDDFLQAINHPGKSWIIITDTENEPCLALKTEEFTRETLFNTKHFNPFKHCYKPIIVRNEKKRP